VIPEVVPNIFFSECAFRLKGNINLVATVPSTSRIHHQFETIIQVLRGLFHRDNITMSPSEVETAAVIIRKLGDIVLLYSQDRDIVQPS
jgi:hypothetical protein